MYVCVCHRVTDTQVREACGNGATSLACLQRDLGLGSCCGRCRECALEFMQDCHAQQACSNTSATQA